MVRRHFFLQPVIGVFLENIKIVVAHIGEQHLLNHPCRVRPI